MEVGNKFQRIVSKIIPARPKYTGTWGVNTAKEVYDTISRYAYDITRQQCQLFNILNFIAVMHYTGIKLLPK